VLSHIDSSTHFIAPQGLTSYHVDNTLPIYGGQDASSFEEEAPPPPPISTISSLSNALVPATRARNVTEPISHSESPYTDEGPTLDSPLWVDQTSNTNVDFMLSGPDVDYDSSRTPSPELSLLPFNCAASLQYPTSVGQGQNILPAPLPPPSSELQTISSTASSSPFVPVISSSNLSASMSTTHSDRMPPEQHPSDPNPRPLKRPRLRRPHGRDQTRLSSHLPADSSYVFLISSTLKSSYFSSIVGPCYHMHVGILDAGPHLRQMSGSQLLNHVLSLLPNSPNIDVSNMRTKKQGIGSHTNALWKVVVKDGRI